MVELDSDKVKKIRERLGITQEQAAVKAGFKSRQQWNQIERGDGKITLATLNAIGAALGMSDERRLLRLNQEKKR